MSMSALREVRAWMNRPAPLSPVPASFRCPCCDKIMTDPVVAADGMTFERVCIVSWLQTGTHISPVTGQPLESLTLFPDVSLRETAREYLRLRDSIMKGHARWSLYLTTTEMRFSGEFAVKEKQIRSLSKIVEVEGELRSARQSQWRERRDECAVVAKEIATEPADLPDVKTPETAMVQSFALPFSSGSAPRRQGNWPVQDVKLMCDKQRPAKMAKGHWWARFCR